MRIAATGACALLLMAFLASCIVTPKKVGVRGKITDSSLAFLQEGKTTQDEVLMHLGLPDQSDQQERWFIYEWATAWGLWFYNESDEILEDFILLIEFDDRGIVSNVKRRKGGIDRLDREFLTEGTTHREDVLLHMGLPDRIDKQGKRFVYDNSNLSPVDAWEELRRFVGDNEILQDFILNMDWIQEIFMASIIIEFDDQDMVSSVKEPEKDKIPNSEDLTWADLDKFMCGEYEGSLSESNFYTHPQNGFTIQFPPEWGTGCKRGSEIIEVEKSVSSGSFQILPDYYLNIRILAHPAPDNSDIWNLAQLPSPEKNSECPVHWICDKSIEVMDSEKILWEGDHAVREVHRVKEGRQAQTFYQLYKLGAGRFGNQPTDGIETHFQRQLLTYWFLRNDRLYQVTGEINARGEVQETYEKAANEWQPIFEKSIRSFHFIN